MRVFELLIDDEDDISGIEKLSIVKSPATQMSWEIFNNKLPHQECFFEEDINPDLLGVIDNYGTELTPDLLEGVEVMEIEEYNHKFYSVSSTPNRKDPLNDLSLDSITRYIYVIDSGAGSVLKPESRQFCRKMIGAGRVYSRADLERISNEIASDSNTFKIIPRPKSIPDVDVYNYKGGKNCYHRYKALVFNLKEGETYEQLLARIPSQAARGVGMADVVYEGSDRPFLSEALHYNMSSQNEFKANNFFMGLFYYPSVMAALVNEPAVRHFTKVKFCGYEGWCPMYIGDEYFEGKASVIDRFEVREKFEVPTQEIQEIGKRVVNWTEENGWGDCGTAVGKTRANQLANGDNLSLETITRMYSYLSRHKVDLESSTSYEYGCGKLMYDSWGGEPALEWSKRIIERASKKEQTFAVNNYKGEITAVVFEPDTYIYRFSEGKSYYVFMSAETIKKALMKVSRLKEMGKLTNLINLEHSDYVFSAEDVYTYENWLVGENPKEDKSYQIFGQEMKPGTWITTIAFKDKEIFEKYVLSNATTGISLEGFFQEVPFNFGDVSRETFVEPRAGESQDDFISRCIPVLIGEGKTQDQAAGACYGMWGQKMEVQINEDKEMVDGVIDLLLKVEDLENRTEIAKEIIRDFALEGVSYDYDDFLRRVGLVNFGFDFPDGTCWSGYEPYGTKIVGGREVPNCVPIKASINTNGMTPYLTPNEDELETKEVFGFIGDIGGAPAYSTESGADSKAKEMGCEGTHYMEGQGYFPCKTHKEAADLYQSQKIYEMIVEVMSNYKQ